MRPLNRHRRDRVAHPPSKTEMIAELFDSNPFVVLTPKGIAEDLDLDLKTVTSIVNRLRDHGYVERIGWGRYRLRTDVAIGAEKLDSIRSLFIDMSRDVLGRGCFGPETIEGSGESGSLMEVYERVREIAGEPFATNVLRVCAKRVTGDDRARSIVRMVSGGSE